MDDIIVSDNPGQQRYELRKEGELAAWADYRRAHDALTITHTEVLPACEGRGLGSRLATLVLDDLRKRGVRVVAQCEFMATWIDRHPDYADLLAER